MTKTGVLVYNKEIIDDRRVSAVIGLVFFILATALGAYVKIPIKGSPVPITLQTFFVILSGAILGKRLGSFSQLGYLVLGTMGMPIFQGCGFGISYLLGPTGGYLIGFVFAAYLVGRMIEPGVSAIRSVAASFIIGSLVIYGFGILWLIYLYRINVINAISIGILPFIPGDIVKIFFATVIYSKISRRVTSIFS